MPESESLSIQSYHNYLQKKKKKKNGLKDLRSIYKYTLIKTHTQKTTTFYKPISLSYLWVIAWLSLLN